ncbi:hypothetical protein CesoFtcFv8_022136 [Champsocephalus esox]|uniref:Uncharacterized protein n=1 Tax=Champsocephalus esox TaxID=159716 RepID=A0AAN8B9Y3_9TELE|nr:hypothetical protein CesoFtcFv8_022136 [Champsocephalus esox]
MITRCQPPVNSQVPAEAIRGEASLELLCFGLVCVGSGLEGPEPRGASSSSTGCFNTHWMRTRDSPFLPAPSHCWLLTQTLPSPHPDKAHQ